MRNKQPASVSEWVRATGRGDPVATGLLYRYLQHHSYPAVLARVMRLGYPKEDAEDWFQDAFIVLQRDIVAGKFQLDPLSSRHYTDQMSAYIMAIVKNRWKKTIEKDKKFRDSGYTSETLAGQIELEFLHARAQEIAAGMASPCKEILNAWYGQKMPAPRIGKMYDWAAKEVRSRVSDCMKSLLQKLNSDLSGSADYFQLENLVQPALNKLDDTCQAMLARFYSNDDRKSWEELAADLGLANEHAARTKKYECMKELHRVIGNELLNH